MTMAVIGTTLPFGTNGTVAFIGPDQPIIVPYQVNPTSTHNILFGQPVSRASGYLVDPVTTVITTTNFFGVAVAEIKTNLTYPLGQNTVEQAYYSPGNTADILRKGIFPNFIQRGSTTVAGAQVYIRTILNGAFPNAVIGGYETSADGSNTVAVPQLVFYSNGGLDSNQSALIQIIGLVIGA